MNAKATAAVKPQDRAEIQRNRILCAAQCCFIRHGFHAASMASIATTAQMSPGLIYRYFDSKNAIILAIIERQNREVRADIAALRSGSDLVRQLRDLFTRWKSCDERVMNPALFLEMAAESSRNPQIARALDEAECLRTEDFTAWIRQSARDSGHELDEADIHRRAFALRCFIEGLAVRAVREPDLDPGLLEESLKLFMPQLLPFHSG